MLSRVAESIYWLNRYLERAENYARFLDVNFNLALERHPGASPQWQPLLQATGDFPYYQQLYGAPTKANAIRFLAFDERNLNSIYSTVSAARENARAVRPEITREVWEQCNALYHYLQTQRAAERWADTDPRDFFAAVKEHCQRIWGLYESTVSRTNAYHFSRIGRLVERADKTSRILDVKYLTLLPDAVDVGSTFDLVQWTALLKSVSAFDMFKRKHGKLSSTRILEFMIFDRRFPRSIFSALLGAEEALRHISGTSPERLNPAQKKLGQIKSRLEYADIDDIIAEGVHEYLDGLQADLNELSARLSTTFFSTDAQLRAAAPATKATQRQSQSSSGQTQS